MSIAPPVKDSKIVKPAGLPPDETVIAWASDRYPEPLDWEYWQAYYRHEYAKASRP